ncbi:MAG: hypothetical protein AAGC74_11315, partial [Verrucomicrobiota bacterium]
DELERELFFSVRPEVRWFSVDGDKGAFEEHWGRPEGWSGGVAKLEMVRMLDEETLVTAEGKVDLPGQVDFTLNFERNNVGAVRFGVEHYRHYFDNSGGYYAPFAEPFFELGRQLEMDRGRVWTALEFEKDRLPRVRLGYEYRFKKGEKSSLAWGPSVQGAFFETRTILPTYKEVDERAHRLTADVSYKWKGILFENELMLEWAEADYERFLVSMSNFSAGPDVLTQVLETTETFRFSDSFRAQKEITDWWFLAGGYYYSMLDMAAAFVQRTTDSMGGAVFDQQWEAQPIVLDWNLQMANVSTRFGPWQDVTLTAGVQSGWEQQEAIGTANLFFGIPDPLMPATQGLLPNTESEEKTFSMREYATIRYAGIPRTSLYARANLEQEFVELSELAISPSSDFARDTDATSLDQEYTVGFTLRPVRRVTWHGNYRFRKERDDYDHDLDEAFGFPGDGYSAFITERDTESHRLRTRVSYRPLSWLATQLGYRYETTDFRTETDAAPFATPGGEILAGEYDSNQLHWTIAISPWERMSIYGSASYHVTETRTASNGDPAVDTYEGEILQARVGATYRMKDGTSLNGSYSYAMADYSQDNVVNGLPLGIDYEQHVIQAGVAREIVEGWNAALQYQLYLYDEGSSGGFNDYTAHGLFLNCQVNWK